MGFSEKKILAEMGQFAGRFFSEYARNKGKGRWSDKTTHYLNHVETIDLMFGHEPLYVGIVRDGRDVAYSLSGFDWGVLKPYLVDGTDKPIASVRFWSEQNRKLLNFREEVGQRF